MALAKAQLPLRIARLRMQNGLSQAALASKTKLAPSVISKLERGTYVGLRLDTLLRLASFFEVSLDYLSGLESAGLARSVTFSARDCPECGKASICHPIPDCMLEMHDKGKSARYIAARFGINVEIVEIIIREEYRLRGRQR
jgi:transcriptional regulator with XRE-family HTH domain